MAPSKNAQIDGLHWHPEWDEFQLEKVMKLQMILKWQMVLLKSPSSC